MAAKDTTRDRGGNGEVCRAIKEHFDLLEYMQSYGYRFKEKSSGGSFQCAEHGSLWVTPAEGLFVWHSQQRGGSIIDFLMMEEKLSAQEAISRLRGEMNGAQPTFQPQKYEARPEPKKELVLPEPLQGKYSRVFAYLTKTRCIDGQIVADVVRRGMLYEDAAHHNCVFVGSTEDGKPSYASIRSTGQKKLVMDVPDSKKTGWLIDNGAPALFVTEAPIDALSVMTLLKLGGKDYRKYSYLAQGGSAVIDVLEQCVARLTKLSRIYLCYDNDAAGRLASEAAQKMLTRTGFRGTVVDKLPMQNDFNDDLKAHAANAAIQKTQIQEETLCFTR